MPWTHQQTKFIDYFFSPSPSLLHHSFRSIVQWLSAVRGKVNTNLSYHVLIAFQFNIDVAAEWTKKRTSFPCLLYVCVSVCIVVGASVMSLSLDSS